MKYREGAGAGVLIRPPVGSPLPVESVPVESVPVESESAPGESLDKLLRALPVGRDIPAKVPGLMWLYAAGEAGPGLAAFVEGLLARSGRLRAKLVEVRADGSSA